MGDANSGEGDFRADGDWVRYEVVEPHIAVITINRPDRRNAILSPDMHDLFKDRLDRAEADDDIKVVVLEAVGKDFSSGDDVRRLPVEQAGLTRGKRLPQTARMGNARRLHRHLTNWLEFPKTVIAACQGATLGAGMNLALAADILVVAGGVIPPGDHESLYRQGVVGVFGPGTPITTSAKDILELLLEAYGE